MLKSYMSRIHVATPAATVERDIRGRCERAEFTDAQTEKYVKLALGYHADNLADYHWVMGPH